MREFSWGVIVLAIGIALSCFIASKCGHAETSFEGWVLGRAMALPVYYEDNPPAGIAGKTTEKVRQLEAISSEIARVSLKAPLPPRRWAALLLTTGYHESAFSLRIMNGSCRKHECDSGRARGVFQGHRLSSMTEETWSRMVGTGNARTQVEQADMMLRRHVGTCPGIGEVGIFYGYMGRRCGSKDAQVEARMATLRSLRP